MFLDVVILKHDHHSLVFLDIHAKTKNISLGSFWLNTFIAEDVSRRQVKSFTKCWKNIKILEFFDYIWNHHEKCIHIRTSMPSIDFEICEICEILRNKSIWYGWSDQWPLAKYRVVMGCIVFQHLLLQVVNIICFILCGKVH